MSDTCPEVSSEKEVVAGGAYTLKMIEDRFAPRFAWEVVVHF